MAEHAAARRSSSRTRTVGLVASHRPWRSELARYVQDHVTGLQVRVLRDPRAVDGSIDVVVIDDSSTFLNRAAVRRLADAGVHVIGIYDPSEQQGHGQRHLNDLGIDDVAVATIPTAELVELIARVAEIERPLPDDAELARLVSGDTVVAGRSPENRQPAPEGRGTLITVGGPAATAAVEIGVGLAAALGHTGRSTLLVDTDEATPCVAARLGYRLEPTVLDAVDVVHHGDADLTHSLTDPTDGARGNVPMHVIAGIANPDDWSLLGRARCVDLLDAATAQWQHVVAVAGSRIASLPQGVDRYGASRGAVAHADTVVGVCEPTPLGVLHALDWLIEARHLRNGRPVWVAFAGHPRSPNERGDLVETVRREAGDALLAGIVFVPMGPEVTRASWDGRIVTSGRFVKALEGLATTIAPGTVPMRRRLRTRAR